MPHFNLLKNQKLNKSVTQGKSADLLCIFHFHLNFKLSKTPTVTHRSFFEIIDIPKFVYGINVFYNLYVCLIYK